MLKFGQLGSFLPSHLYQFFLTNQVPGKSTSVESSHDKAIIGNLKNWAWFVAIFFLFHLIFLEFLTDCFLIQGCQRFYYAVYITQRTHVERREPVSTRKLQNWNLLFRKEQLKIDWARPFKLKADELAFNFSFCVFIPTDLRKPSARKTWTSGGCRDKIEYSK